MGKITSLTLAGADLKQYILDNFIDENNKKLSVRKFVTTHWKKIGGCPVVGNFTYWASHDDIVNAEPYKGEKVNERLIYKYAIDKGLFTEEEVPFEKFSSLKEKQKVLISKQKLWMLVAKKLKYGFTSMASIEMQEKGMRYMLGDKVVDKALNDVMKDFIKQAKEKNPRTKYTVDDFLVT